MSKSGKRETQETRVHAILAALGAIVLWCWSGICFRKGSEIMGTMVYLTFMTGGGALTAVLLQCFRHKPLLAIFILPRKMIIAGFFGVAIYTMMLATAFGIAAPSDLGQINLLNYLWPVWMVVLGIMLLKDRPNPYLTTIGILLGLIGVMVSRGLDQLAQIPSDFTAHGLALTGGFLWALYSVLLRKWQIQEENGGTAFHFAICAIISGTVAFLQNQWHTIPPITANMLFWIIFGAVGPVGLAYSWWEIGVKKGPVYLIASLAYFIPIGSSLLIGLVYKETMNSGLLAGAVLIAFGAGLVRYAVKE